MEIFFLALSHSWPVLLAIMLILLTLVGILSYALGLRNGLRDGERALEDYHAKTMAALNTPQPARLP